jgi:hypothetical protein
MSDHGPSLQAPRAVFVQWPLLIGEGERVLDDLAAWTQINMIELSNFYLDWYEPDGAAGPAPLALPPQVSFADLSVRVLDPAVARSVASVIGLIQSRGLDVAWNLCPLYVAAADLESLACVDVTGRRVRGHHPQVAIEACPSNPDTVRYAETMAQEFVRSWPVDVLTVNHAEYSIWPQTGLHHLFSCFCDACGSRADAEGLDFEAMRHAVAELYETVSGSSPPPKGVRLSGIDLLNVVIERPLIAGWLNFRMRAMTDLVARVAQATRAAAAAEGRVVKLGLESMLPSLARLFGSDFVRLAPLFDWVSPKFPDYLTASAVPIAVDAGLRDGSPAEQSELRRGLRELSGLGLGPSEYQPISDPTEGILFSNTFDVAMINDQLKYLAALNGPAVYPYVWKYLEPSDGAELLSAKLRALREAGFEGFFLSCSSHHMTRGALRAAAGIL